MTITYEFGKIIVDGYIFNDLDLCGPINKILNEVDIARDYYYTPSEIVFHRCHFKDTNMTLMRNDYIVVNNPDIVYNFNGSVRKFYGEYPLNISVNFEFCKFFACSWSLDASPSPIVVYDIYYNKLANLNIFIDYNMLEYETEELLPTYPSSAEYGYKILCNKSTTNTNDFYLCKVSFPSGSNKMSTIAGEIRCNKFKVESIKYIVTTNAYEYGVDNIKFKNIGNVNKISHYSFYNQYGTPITYTVGNIVSVSAVETNSYHSTGPGLYAFNHDYEAIIYLNRVIPKECNMVINEDGTITLLSDKLLSMYEMI